MPTNFILPSTSFLYLLVFMGLDLPYINIIYIPYLIATRPAWINGLHEIFFDKMALILELTHFSPMLHFYIPWKRHNTADFLTLPGGIE